MSDLFTKVRGTNISTFTRAYSTRNEGKFPQRLPVVLIKESDKKYGENPGQQAAVYRVESVDGQDCQFLATATDLRYARTDDQGKGGLSLTNEMDITGAMHTLSFFTEFHVPAVVIMKHDNVSGFARQISSKQTQTDLFRLARDADRQSNFGGTTVFNQPLTMPAAEALYELKGASPFFVDVLAAPDFDEGVIDYVQRQSKNVRIGKFSRLDAIPKFRGDNTYNSFSFKNMPTGRMGVQTLPLTSIRNTEDLILDPMVIDKEGGKHIIARDPTPREMDDLMTAWWLNTAKVKSNGVVAVRDGVSVSIGTGQVERVGAVNNMIIKGMQKAYDRAGLVEGRDYDALMGIYGWETILQGKNPFEGASVSSDGFLPFADSLKQMARVGVSAVVQPYGSVRDAEVIDAANTYNMAMPATLERCFVH